ncbi:MAG: UDP-N-acetylmuramoyl-L-alanyl-D-glutamate--2,6-diaminopimelate ligase [Thermoanaerobaculia bacterium]|nr:UDP-N-acetylmuramoyl-L-alanyl-D-glutamate--2,6-diaminopimelate ligase [Thermoanaerobaculia bacterium]
MRLSALLEGLAVGGRTEAEAEVAGLAYDSRRVVPGDLFVTWAGERHDGAAFAAEAVARGAVAVIAPSPRPEGAPEATAALPWLVADAPRALLGPLAARLLGDPGRHLTLVGITGTNGKSTIAALVTAMLEAAGRPCGLLGTLGHRFRGEDLTGGGRTTPEGSDLVAAFAALATRGGVAAAMEVSSHALAQGRVEGTTFDVAAFVNLTRDHLDFHGSMEAYYGAKRRLFDQLRPGGRAVVNRGDSWGARLAGELVAPLTCGERGDVAALGADFELTGTTVRLRTPRGPMDLRVPLVGRYHVENVVLAVAIAEALELPHEAVIAGAAALRPPAGRMEAVAAGQPFPVFIDYAHTPAALEAALRALRDVGGRRVAVVFGCGGDRDPGKREEMGEIAGRLADLPIVTSDNPRGEDPLAIIAMVEAGLRRSGNREYRVVPDRREAIRKALAVAGPSRYAVLVAGKGHEREQIVGAERRPFSDREEIERALAELAGQPAAAPGGER